MRQRNINSGKGQSSRARCLYVLRRGEFAERQDLLTWGTAALPAWADADPVVFFGMADQCEARGQVAKSVDFALPSELSPVEREELVRDFVATSLVDTAGNPFPAVWAIHHSPDNPHFHLVYSRRANDGLQRPSPEIYFRRANKKNPEKGGAAKDKTTATRQWLRGFRKAWQDAANRHLADAGLDVSIDCRTLKAQGIDRKPRQKSYDEIRIEKLCKELEEDRAELDALLAAFAEAEEEAKKEDDVARPPQDDAANLLHALEEEAQRRLEEFYEEDEGYTVFEFRHNDQETVRPGY
jgi:ATP-dependent exoDNAse (exonuclease V) alpha subunit